jgi:hypothetical protein
MPFGGVNRPAIGVSLLKAALGEIGVATKIHYFNLKFAERIGLKFNGRLESSGMYALMGELIFASFAFATFARKKRNIRDILHQICNSKHFPVLNLDKVLDDIVFAQKLVPEFLDKCVCDILLEKPKLVGFSSTYDQNCASLALAKAIKETADIPIIFGGANCEG